MRFAALILLLLLSLSGLATGEDDAGALLRALANVEHADHEAALDRWEALEPEARITLLRDALMGGDEELSEIGTWAIGPEYLSLAEIHRQMEFVVRAPDRTLFGAADRYAWALGGWSPPGAVDLVALATHAVDDPAFPPEEDGHAAWHRAMAPDLLPRVVPLLEKGNADAFAAVRQLVTTAADYDGEDRHRDLLVHASLYVVARLEAEAAGLPRPRLEDVAAGPAGAGLPDAFVRLAREQWTGGSHSEAVALQWIRRWARDLIPSAKDVALLKRLVDASDSYVPLWALGHLARLGDEEARAALAEARVSGEREVAWALDPVAAREQWLAEALDSEGGVSFEIGPEDRADHRCYHGLEIRAEDLRWLGEQMLAEGTPAWRSVWYFTEVWPEGLTDVIAAELVERLRAVETYAEGLECEQALGVLEAHAPAALRKLLRLWATHEGGGLADLALILLARLGETGLVPEMLAASTSWMCEWVNVDLGRVRDPLVRRFLEAKARSEDPEEAGPALAALMVAQGLPARLFHEKSLFDWGEDEVDLDEEPYATVRHLVLKGDAVGALITLSEAHEGLFTHELGLLKDERARAILHRLRRERHRGLYWHATAGLALAGDEAARSEFLALLADDRTWMFDALFEQHLALEGDPTLTEFWLSRLDANCCLGFHASCALGIIYPTWPFESGMGVVRERFARAWLEGATPVRSEILDGWVPVRRAR